MSDTVMGEFRRELAAGRMDGDLLRAAAGELRWEADCLLLEEAEDMMVDGAFREALALEVAASAAVLDERRQAEIASADELVVLLSSQLAASEAALAAARAALAQQEAFRTAVRRLSVELAAEQGRTRGLVEAVEALRARPRAVRVLRDDVGRVSGYEVAEA